MTNEMLFYKESGRIGVGAIVIMILAGVLVALLLGFVYAYAVFYIPFIYLNFILTFFYGAAVGFAVMWAGRVGKARNTLAISIFGVLMGVVAVYTQWVFWVHALTGSTEGIDATFLWSPANLWGFLNLVAENGVWSFGRSGEPVKGVILWIVWAIEAGIIVFAAMWVSRLGAGGVFCERCDRWAEDEPDLVHLELGDKTGEAIEHLVGGSFESLKQLQRAPDESAFFQIGACNCPQCKELNTLNAKVVVHQLDEKGNIQKQETPVLAGLLTPRPVLDDLKNHWVNLPIAQPPTQEPPEGIPPQAGPPPEGQPPA